MSHRDETLSRLRPFGIVFEKSLSDLIRGIRAAKDPQAREAYLRQAITDCHTEVRSADMDTKTMAVLKLTYLEMYGYDMSWSSFYVLEVMSSAKFQQKRVGYLAAMQSFRTDTDVLMLTTNLFKKDLGSAKPLDVSVALSGIASMVTPSLAQDLSDDIIKMLTHSRPYIRKKAILAMHKVFLQYPEAFKVAFPRLRDRLNDPDPSVVSATVNVICELAKQSPAKNLVSLAPQLYEILTTSKNNWMLIKILKLFSSLAPREPRLKPKLLPPILQLMDSTSAMSLLYECINCIVSGGMLHETDYELASKCVNKLMVFLEETDQNLKYVGLLALTKVLTMHPQFLGGQQALILRCLDDRDLTIREQCLSLLSLAVNEDNLYDIVTRLLDQLRNGSTKREHSAAAEALAELVHSTSAHKRGGLSNLDSYIPYRVQVIRKIIDLCSSKTYELLPDFYWYIGLLVELVDLAPDQDAFDSDPRTSVGALIGEEFRNIALRVKSIRESVIYAAVNLLTNQFSKITFNMPSVLFGVVWAIGEYSSEVRDPLNTIDILLKIEAELSTSGNRAPYELTSLSCIFIQAIMKLYTRFASSKTQAWTVDRSHSVLDLTKKVVKYLEKNATNFDFEVQERAVGFLELLKVTEQAIEEHNQSGADEPPLLLTVAFPSLFNGNEIQPVARRAQKRIPPPEGLDLNEELCPGSLLDNSTDDDYDDFSYDIFKDIKNLGPNYTPVIEEQIFVPDKKQSDEESDKQRQEREKRIQNDPFYLGSNVNSMPSTRSASPSLASGYPGTPSNISGPPSSSSFPGTRRAKVEILKDVDVEDDEQRKSTPKKPSKKKGLLHVESRLRNLDLSDEEDVSISQAKTEVEKIRESFASNAPSEIAVVHKKIKKSSTTGEPKKKKKKKKLTDGDSKSGQKEDSTIKKEKKKPAVIEDAGA